jgi:transcriptional regulator with XRE-family HTH domain
LLTFSKNRSPLPLMDEFSDTMASLRAARALVGLRQEALSDLAGVSRQMIVRIENGDKTVPVSALEKVKAALEKAGVAFLPETAELGRAIALRKKLTPTTRKRDGTSSR